VRVKCLVHKGTTQTTCLRLIGKKMLVALMMEGKFSGEGLHSIESDDDLMSAMARELVERGNIGESAAAVWADLKREREQQMPSINHFRIFAVAFALQIVLPCLTPAGSCTGRKSC
jgi:hypothetical protein